MSASGGAEAPGRVFLGLGSNLGDREAMLRAAAAALVQVPGVSLAAASSIYETEPWGLREQPPFLNCVVEISTRLSPAALLARVQEIEERLGRRPGARWGPRAIDIDLLLWVGLCLEEENLTLPHPALERRRFALVPLAELDPGVREPLHGRSAQEMLARCGDRGAVVRRGPFAVPPPAGPTTRLNAWP